MAKQLKIALNYSYNEAWIGGTYYIENLIWALNTLPQNKKPIILILSTLENYNKLKERIDYPYLSHHKIYDDRNIIWRILNKFWQIFFYSRKFEKKINVDGIFPYSGPILFLNPKNKFYWIPDFQEHFLSELFSKEEVIARKNNQLTIAESEDNLILSSKDAFNHFQKIYPYSKIKPYVLPFAVSLPSLEKIDFNQIKFEYQLVNNYLICANQLWVHKDHITLIKAVHQLKKENIKIVVYLTGKTEDYRFPNYYQQILDLIKNYQLEKQIIPLGFLDRKIQLTILKNAKAVIQPSLFEGWSTVIEDAKALNKFIIASNISIHQEQLLNYPSLLFEEKNPNKLAECIKLFMSQSIGTEFKQDYKVNIQKFGNSFLSILNNNV
ncbi:glycosyltransferase [Pedobacter glucosidilyticus]|uniref:glycosyltransferase n=1 Tax=Pedobacter glucosidilyticus TaxID=1122941 RepID=UPI0026EBC03B|nr:glycosyltransferase [Pedobacter glucosidilyticus]